MPTHAYAFDVTLNSVVRIEADTEEIARQAVALVLDAASLNVILRDGDRCIQITEASAADDPVLFEVDGVALDSE